MLKGIINYAHHLIEGSVLPSETVIDATCGNGNDTLFLSKLVGSEGHVLAFDVQQQAIDNTKELLMKHDLKNASIILDSHANIATYTTEKGIQEIGGAIFNLGYLPRSDKTIITKGDSTIQAVDTILPLLKKNGLIILVIYHGHEGGKSEKHAVLDYAKQLDQKHYQVLQYGFINQKNNPPFVVAIQKR